jgi:hypothetical protein
MSLICFKGTLKGRGHNGPNLLKTFSQVGGYTGNVPSETKGNFFVLGASQLEADSGRDTIGVGYKSTDVKA